MGVGLLVDRRGNDRYTSMESFAQGASLAGRRRSSTSRGTTPTGPTATPRARRSRRGSPASSTARATTPTRPATTRRASPGREPWASSSTARATITTSLSAGKSAATGKTASSRPSPRDLPAAFAARPRRDRRARRRLRQRCLPGGQLLPGLRLLLRLGHSLRSRLGQRPLPGITLRPGSGRSLGRRLSLGRRRRRHLRGLDRRGPEPRLGPLRHGVHG